MSRWRFRKAAVSFAPWFGPGCLLAAGAAGMLAARANEPVWCSLRAQPEAEWLRLEALARSDSTVTGRYRFSVVKQNAAGSSQNMQSGSFELVPGEEQILTTLLLEKAAMGHYRAQLTLTRDDGSISCVTP